MTISNSRSSNVKSSVIQSIPSQLLTLVELDMLDSINETQESNDLEFLSPLLILTATTSTSTAATIALPTAIGQTINVCYLFYHYMMLTYFYRPGMSLP